MDLQRVLGAMHPRARDRFHDTGPCWPQARAIFFDAARRLGLEISYSAYILEQHEIAELVRDVR